MSAGAPFGTLPVDPVNASATNDYYTYVTSSTAQWEFTTMLDSQKYQPDAINDGDSYTGIYSGGNTHGITPGGRDYGLIGYWKFDEGAGSFANDAPFPAARGTLVGGTTWSAGPSGAPCPGFSCVYFDASDNDYVSLADQASFGQPPLSVSLWYYANQLSSSRGDKQFMLFR